MIARAYDAGISVQAAPEVMGRGTTYLLCILRVDEVVQKLLLQSIQLIQGEIGLLREGGGRRWLGG